MAELQVHLDTETDRNSQPDVKDRMKLVPVSKCTAIPSNSDASVPVKSSSPRLLYMGMHPNLMHNRMILPTSRIVNVLSHVQIPIPAANFEKKWTISWARMFIEVGTQLQNVIVHLDQAASITSGKGETEEDNSVTESIASVHWREKKWRDDQMERTSKWKTVVIIIYKPTGKKTITWAKSTLGNVKKFWTTLKNFDIYGLFQSKQDFISRERLGRSHFHVAIGVWKIHPFQTSRKNSFHFIYLKRSDCA